MDPMDKMWASFVAIGLMIVASLLITFARHRTKGWVRFVLSFIACLLFIPILLYMLVALI